MKIYDRQKFDYKNYNIYCYTYETAASWGHNATIFDQKKEIATDKVRYYNRTWESYTYQSIILSTITKAIEARKQNIFDNYKYFNNISRLSKEKKEQLEKDDQEIKDLKDAYKYFDKEYRG